MCGFDNDQRSPRFLTSEEWLVRGNSWHIRDRIFAHLLLLVLTCSYLLLLVVTCSYLFLLVLACCYLLLLVVICCSCSHFEMNPLSLLCWLSSLLLLHGCGGEVGMGPGWGGNARDMSAASFVTAQEVGSFAVPHSCSGKAWESWWSESQCLGPGPCDPRYASSIIARYCCIHTYNYMIYHISNYIVLYLYIPSEDRRSSLAWARFNKIECAKS